jgi:iron complex outermembrane receptor protein
MKRKLLAVAIAMASANAIALEGTVTNENGKPISNAQVEVIGGKVFSTDSNGKFSIAAESVDEIHIKATGYNHKVLHLHGDDTPLTISLSPSVFEVVDVVGIPIHASKIEAAQPINVIAGENLRKKQAATLGETLKNEVGVQSSYYGGVASSPVIRGLDGPRVLITQNGLDVSDVSRVGPDHVVATEASTAQQVEILRGPATLFYGSGAIGGVVNIVDDRVPQSGEFKAAIASEYNSVNEESALSGALTTGNEVFAVHVDGFWRDGENYEIPGLAEYETEEEHEEEGHEEHEDEGILENSASESSGFNLGASALFDSGFIGLSYGRLDRSNGIPGHGHGEEHGDHEEEEEGHEEEEHAEERIVSEMEQDRWQLLSEYRLDNQFLTSINTRLGYTDYEHAEIHEEAEHDEHEEEEEGEHEHADGTVFKNSTFQARVDFGHKEIAGWKGAFSIEHKNIDFEASGEEAFTPASETEEFALAIIEELHHGELLWQLGARIENISLSAADLEFEHHHEEEEEEEGEEEHEEVIEFDQFEFTPLSLSAGLVWDFADGYNLGVSLAHAERAPSAAELFSAGPHIATRSYEIGALFEIHEEDGEFHLEYEGNAEKEVSNNLDISLRKFEGDFGFVLNAFYNQVSDYYHLADNGLTTHDLFEEHEEEEEIEDEHGHEEELPVYIFQQEDAKLKGLEAELAWQITPNLKWTAWGDTVQAELDSGENLPRISPTRLASQFNLDIGSWQAELSAVNYLDQDNVAPNERETEGYTLIDARVSYDFEIGNGNLNVYLSGSNLGDEEARVHTSFLKDQAPLPGRNIKLGVYASF